MRNLETFWCKAMVSRVDTHIYFEAKIYYKWRDDVTTYEVDFIPESEVDLEVFYELVKRKVIFEIEKIPSKKFFHSETYDELEEFVEKNKQIVFTNAEEFQPKKHLFFQINVNLIRSDEVVFDMLFWGYKYPFTNIKVPIEVFHEFTDRLEPKLRINTIHGARRLKLFISHASEDKPFVRKLADDLLNRGILVWFDEWEIKVGESIVQKINDGIEESSFMAVVFSKTSILKPWVKQEINAGFMKGMQEKGIYLLPILLEKCKLPPLITDKKYADFTKSYDSGLAELLASL